MENCTALTALDKFLSPLPAKERLEKETGQSIPDVVWYAVIGVDRAYNQDEIRTMCRREGLKVSGDKHELALRLLNHWFESKNQSK